MKHGLGMWWIYPLAGIGFISFIVSGTYLVVRLVIETRKIKNEIEVELQRR